MVEVKVEKKVANPLMDRDEATCIVTFEQGTPKHDELKAAIAKALAATQDMLVINRFVQHFGAKQAKAFVSVYKTPEAMKRAVKEKKKEEKKPTSS